MLSGGERRRVEIARSLVINPSFLLLDEPFSGIDPIQVLELQRIIFDLKRSGIGILITDHAVRETLVVTDRAYIINNGRIFRAGSPEALERDPEVKRIYLGEIVQPAGVTGASRENLASGFGLDKTMRYSLLALLAAASAWAQPFSAGVKVGLPLTDFIQTVSGEASSVTNRYLVGATAELHLPFGLGIEADAIYRHFNYQNVIGSGASALVNLNTAGDWEFPVLLKYRFPGKVARPFVDAGVAWDRITGLTSTVSSVAGLSSAQNTTTMGAVVGAGVDIHFIVHIMPEVRYTRWTSQHFNIANVLNSNQNQAEFMVGVTF